MTTSEQSTRRTVRMRPGRHAPPPNRELPSPHRELPPFGLIMARPLILLVAALLGAVCGFALAGGAGYQAQAMLQFTTQSQDSLAVKQTGQTLARRVLAADVVTAAENAAGVPAGSFAGHVTADWQQDTNLVEVSAAGTSPEAAMSAANALAASVVQVTESQVQAELDQAHADSSDLLGTGSLPSRAAEDARQAQVGLSLANRQDTIAARSGSVGVLDPASTATPAGITAPMGTLIGLVGGLLVGGLVAILLGVRGLRIRSIRSLRTLFPTYRINSAAEAARLVGEILESGRQCIAVVCPPGTTDDGLDLAEDLAAFAGAHGHSVRSIGLVGDRTMALATVARDVRTDVSAVLGADVMVAVVETGSDAAHLLEGQSDFAAVVVARRRSTPVAAAAAAMEAFDRAMPSLVLTR